MYESIVVAYEASPASDHALKAAAELATKFGATVNVVHVRLHGRIPPEFARMAEVEGLVGPNILSGLTSGSLQPDMDDPLDQDPARRLGGALGDMLLRRAETRLQEAGVQNIQTHFLQGEAAEQIVNTAAGVNADLIIMGSRGLGELKGLMLGSVSHKVLQLAECAVLIVK